MTDEPVVTISEDSTFTDEPGVPEALETDVAAARASLAAATTVAQVRSRTIALFDLLAAPSS